MSTDTITTTAAIARARALKAGPEALAELDLPALAEMAKAANRGAIKAARQTMESIRDAGMVLLAMKEKIGHGNFMAEVEKLTEIHHRTAGNYMLIARHFGNVSNLKSVRDALQYIRNSVKHAEESEARLLPPPPAPPPPIEVDIVPDTRPPSKGITLDAEIVEKDDHREDEARAPEAQVDEDEQSPAPSAPSAHLQVLHLLPDLDQDELADVIRVINTRWIRK